MIKSENERPDPDKLLNQISKDEKKETKGKLKIFFGYAAGVGKTYAMLDAAQADYKSGVDVVAGYVEPHARPDTLALLNGLEQIQPLLLEYKGIQLKEFDLDAALKRKPKLILVDELAHTNAAGCRHRKRYQDVKELLEAGIDVYSTVNVQHLESLNDIVASITHIAVHERIPDSIFDEAAQVELVDIEPEQLIGRLNQGKIYKQTQAKKAIHNFFSKENLASLREIALRRTADRVNHEIMEEKSSLEGKDYYTGEHILVCISASPTNAKVIRTAARMANAFKAEMIALFVETSLYEEAEESVKKRVYENFTLAKQFGAKAAVVPGDNVPYQISEYAKANGISKIVVGRTSGGHRLFSLKPNFIEKLTDLAPNQDIYVIPDQGASTQKSKKSKSNPILPADIFKMLGVLFLSTILAQIIDIFGFGTTSIVTLYIVAVVLAAWTTQGRTYGILASVASVLLFNFFFTDPRFSLNFYNKTYIFTFFSMLCASLITSYLTTRLRRQVHQELIKSRRTETLLNTSHKLRRAMNADRVVEEGARQVAKLLNRDVVVYNTIRQKLENPDMILKDGESEGIKGELFSEDEKAVAAWVFKTRHRAGRTTDTLPGAKAYYTPVYSEKQVFAVYGVVLEDDEKISTLDKNILKAMLTETAFAAEKYVLSETQKKLQMDTEKDRVRSNLLRAVSHDLRTPLASITGHSSMLLESGELLDEDTKKNSYASIYDDSVWLNNLVENILAVTKIDSENPQIKMENEQMEDIIQDALGHVNRYKKRNKIKVNMEENFIVKSDIHLISRVIMNMVDNGMRYSQADAVITITARRINETIAVEIADNGPGISDEDKKKIFDLYFKTSNNSGDNRRGLGLGLSLCKTIIDAHNGEVYVKDNVPQGTIFGFTLPQGRLE